MEKNLTHLHLHTDYSLLDGFGSCASKAKRAKELGMKAIAITDHNTLGGTLDFQKACKAEGVKPILGLEAYWTKDRKQISMSLDDRYNEAEKKYIEIHGEEAKEELKKLKAKERKDLLREYLYDTKSYHLILLAKNQTGWNNLVKIQSIAAQEGLFNGRFHCDNDLLRKYSEGLICATACLGSYTSNNILKGNINEVEQAIDEWVDIFGKDNFFLEIQPLDMEKQYIVNNALMCIAESKGLNLIATNDSHYTLEEDAATHDVLICIQYERLVSEEDRVRYAHEYWIKSYDEMVEGFKRRCDDEDYIQKAIQALDNTNKIADMIDEDIKIGSKVPLFTNVPTGKRTNEEYLSQKCWRALYKYLKKHPEYDTLEYEKRLKFELSVINTKGYAPYMLTVDEYINWSNNNGAPTGPGRGSAAGSLVLFLLNITKIIDPIQHNLLFSRFLTMDRTALPDIDTDFCYYGRNDVIKHMEDTYGKECVAHIGTYTELGVKSGLKDVGKVLGYPFKDMNLITKIIDKISGGAPSFAFKDIDKLEEENPNAYKEYKELENKYEELFYYTRKLEGTKRNFGVHASGLLVTPCPITDVFPVRFDSQGTMITLYTGPEVEECNGVKYDFLGLKTVSVIDKAIKSIDKDLTWEKLYDKVSFTDKESFELINAGHTEAIFQLESDLFKSLIKQMNITSLDEITILTSIGRPGPLQANMHTKFANRQKGIDKITMPLHGVENILSDTLGTIVYQEQVMAISKLVAGFDDNQADSYLRKALAKKKRKMMDLCKRWFVYGKRNTKAPEGYVDTPNSIMYDEEGKYGSEILGGTNNGYDEKTLITFWDDIEGYASYLSNK